MFWWKDWWESRFFFMSHWGISRLRGHKVVLCRPSNLTLNVLPQPSPMSGTEQSRGRMEKHIRLRGLYFSYHSVLKWNYGGGGYFSSNDQSLTRGEGGRLAGREGGERIYYTFISVCVMMLKGCLPVLLTRIIIMDELNSAAHIKETHHEELLICSHITMKRATQSLCFDVYSI